MQKLRDDLNIANAQNQRNKFVVVSYELDMSATKIRLVYYFRGIKGKREQVSAISGKYAD